LLKAHLVDTLTRCLRCFADKASAAITCLRSSPGSVQRRSTPASVHDGR
jgi:hypothetical protein